MNQSVHLSVDLMGGDFGAEVTLPAALDALRSDPSLSLTLVGLPDSLASVSSGSARQERLFLQPCESAIAMDERVSTALRNGKNSSIGEMLSLVGRGCDGAVSAGNTGALMALGMQTLGCFDAIERPVLGTAIPSTDGHTWLMDMGANLDCSIDNLHQFALLGSMLCASLDGIKRPRVGLLNVGREQSKGTAMLQDAAKLLAGDSRIEYVGFAEGNDLFADRFDLIITDGMNGNIALKTTEGAARFILDSAREALFRDLRSRLGLWMLKPSLSRFRERMDPSRYNGAPMLGLQGLVVKSHGSANRDAFRHSIDLAARLARSGVVDRIGESLSTG